MFFEVCRHKNIEFNRGSLLDAHFDAPCINKMAAYNQITSDRGVTSLTSCQGQLVRDEHYTMLKFGDDIGSEASDRRQFRSDTSLRFVTFWAGCYEVTLP